MTTAVHAAIAKRFPAPEWCVMHEVRDEAGFNARRSADVVAINTWPSRGLAVHGIEVKVSRSDWLRELKDPAKSMAIQRFCDRWWLAVSDDKVAKLEEVPATWGLLVLRGKALVQVKEAPQLAPEPLTRGFVAMLLRNATSGMVPNTRVDELVQERLERYVENNRDMATRDAERTKEALKALGEKVRAFEEASGIKIDDRYSFGNMRDPKKLGEGLRALLQHDSPYGLEYLQRAKREADDMAKHLAAAIEAVSEIGKEAP